MLSKYNILFHRNFDATKDSRIRQREGNPGDKKDLNFK